MAVLNKTQLLQNRIDNIYPNLSNEVSAAMVGTFCDNFIDSIYDYTDKKWGLLETWDDTRIGTLGENYIDFSSAEMSIYVVTDKLEIDMSASPQKIIETNATDFVFTSNPNIYSNAAWLKIGVDTLTTNPHIIFDGNDIKISTDFDNGQLSIWDTFNSTDLMTIAGNTTNMHTNLIVNSANFVRGKYRSSDNSLGMTETLIISSPLLDRTMTIKDGIVTSISSDGWDVQLDVFDQSTTDPLPGATIDIYPQQAIPPTGTPIATYTTDSIGRVIFKANPNATYRLHIYKAVYDDIFPELIIDANPKVVNYSLPYTG